MDKELEKIVAAYKVKAQQIVDKYYEDFDKKVVDKTHKNVWKYLVDQQPIVSGEVTTLLLTTLHESQLDSIELLNALYQNGTATVMELTSRIQSRIKDDK